MTRCGPMTVYNCGCGAKYLSMTGQVLCELGHNLGGPEPQTDAAHPRATSATDSQVVPHYVDVPASGLPIGSLGRQGVARPTVSSWAVGRARRVTV
jgi:hypothetical protein